MRKLIPSPLKAIRAKCLSCAGSPKEVRFCQITSCPIYQFRMGRNPNRAGVAPNVAQLNGKSHVESKEIPKDGHYGNV